MASVYKSLSKKKSRSSLNQQDEENIDPGIGIDDMMDEDDTSDSDENETEGEDSDGEGVGLNGDGNVLSKKDAQSQLSSRMPKSRVLMLTSRGVTHRHRHLLADLAALLPHTHKETKLDTKKKTAGYNFLLNSLAELHSCNVIFFLEARKHGQDLYLWLSRPPNGPTIKFAVNNLHTMGELGTGFAGNCLKGGRGVVVFDNSFDDKVIMKEGNEWRGLVREMLRGVFSVPKRGVRGMKPFIDRIIGVYYVDGKIWIRVFEIRETDGEAPAFPGAAAEELQQKAAEDDEEGTDKQKHGSKKKAQRGKAGAPDISLVEIGPRFVLTPIVILEGSFGGPVIYENKEYVSPNQVRREARLQRAGRYATRQTGVTDRTVKMSGLGLTTEGKGNRKKDVLDSKALFS